MKLLLLCLLTSAAIGADPPKQLRKDGFVFLEFNTRKREEYSRFFQAVMGFKVKFNDPHNIELETDVAQILLNDPDQLPKGHPFYGFKDGGQGSGLEIGLVVADIEKTFAAAKQQGWRISTGIIMRPWGVRDFRVIAPDGYYLRFTEPPAH